MWQCVCAAAIFRGADFMGGLRVSESAGALHEKTCPVCKSFSFFAPFTAPSPPALHNVGTVTQRSN